MCRDYQTSDSPAEGGEGSSQPQELTPAQQHHQYLGDGKPELVPFPEIEWADTIIPGVYFILNTAFTSTLSTGHMM